MLSDLLSCRVKIREAYGVHREACWKLDIGCGRFATPGQPWGLPGTDRHDSGLGPFRRGERARQPPQIEIFWYLVRAGSRDLARLAGHPRQLEHPGCRAVRIPADHVPTTS